MIVDDEPRRQPPYQGQPYAGGAYPDGRRRSALRRFLGGSPAAVFVKLAFLSVLVGAVMAMMGLTPRLLILHAYDAAQAAIALGLDAFHDFGGWILAGAVVVVPLWLISRLLGRVEVDDQSASSTFPIASRRMRMPRASA